MGIFPGEEMVKKMINIRIFTNNNQDISWDYLGELPIDGWWIPTWDDNSTP